MGVTHFELQALMPPLPNVRDSFVIKYTSASLNEYHRFFSDMLGNLVGTPVYQQVSEHFIYTHKVRQPTIQFDYIPGRAARFGRPAQPPRLISYPLPFHLPNLVSEPHKKVFEKPAAVAIGPITNTDPYIVNYRSTNNHVRGLVKRVAHAFTDNGLHRQSFRQFVKTFIKRYQPLPHIPISHEVVDELWLKSAHQYTKKQKMQFHKLLDSYLNTDNVQAFLIRYASKLYVCDSFIKREFYDELKEPRIINARPDLFKVLVAPYIKMIEHEVLHNDHFIKKKTPEWVAQRMRSMQSRFRFVTETDYSSFEGSFHPEFMKSCEYALFKHMLKNNPDVMRLIKPIYFNPVKLILKTSRDNKDFAKMMGSRMSGEMWTSLGNCFTNMMLFLYMVKKSVKRKQFATAINNIDFIIEGDDGFLAHDFELNTQIVRDLGFQLKINTASDINDLSFCGINTSPDGTPYPAFRRTLVKFGYCHDETVISKYSKNITTLEKEYMRAKAMSLLANSAGNPILQPLALKVLELTKDVHPKAYQFDWWDIDTFDILHMHIAPKEITNTMRKIYYERFNITVKRQYEIEHLISTMTSLRFIIPIQFSQDRVINYTL